MHVLITIRVPDAEPDTFVAPDIASHDIDILDGGCLQVRLSRPTPSVITYAPGAWLRVETQAMETL